MKYFAGCFVALSLSSLLAYAQVIYDSASTVGESYARGAADVIHAQGQRNLSNSQAAINAQDAYSAAIDNHLKSINAFWERKDIYQQRVDARNYQIAQRREMLLAQNRLQPLTPEEFDRTTGRITWPRVLEQDQYSKYRTTLDELFQARAYNGALTGDQYMQAEAASREWRALLNSQQDVYPRSILSQMVRFILKLERELDENLS